ncbi:MAG TPA: hypothetical protein VFL59_15555, partial [Candidatus Nanopelagicales bacterium]|nr:hypothetical protein [Candidatus Nanopelagicales bacterium]
MSDLMDAVERATQTRGRLVLAVAGAVLLVFVGYVLGSGRSSSHEVTGPAQVGDPVADTPNRYGSSVRSRSSSS